ncbi:MAG: hypothetical protein VKJ24_01745 [Synechococcales bacterium]|nr:hypothetical protein [Synechococcales bacterium]
MGRQGDRQVTGRFISVAPYLCLCMSLVLLLVLMFSPSVGKTVFSRQVTVESEQPVTVGTLTLPPDRVGVLQVEAIALLPTNRWATYEIQLVNSREQLLLSAVKESWRETGSWQEEGQTGTWDEGDTTALLNFRPTQRSEPIQVVIEVLELSDHTGKKVTETLPFSVTIRRDPLNVLPLWLGWFLTVGLTGLAFWTVPRSGRVILRAVGSHLTDRPGGEIGVQEWGQVTAHQLVRLSIEVQAPPRYSSPRVILMAKVLSPSGQELWCEKSGIDLNLVKRSTIPHHRQGFAEYFLLFEQSDSYQFLAQVQTAGQIEQVKLCVRDRVQTRMNVNLNTVKAGG